MFSEILSVLQVSPKRSVLHQCLNPPPSRKHLLFNFQENKILSLNGLCTSLWGLYSISHTSAFVWVKLVMQMIAFNTVKHIVLPYTELQTYLVCLASFSFSWKGDLPSLNGLSAFHPNNLQSTRYH